MNWKGLLSRVVFVVVIALLPGLALQGYSDIEDSRNRGHLIDEQVLGSFRLVTDAEERIVDGSALMLNAISAAPAVQDQNPPACRRLLENIVTTEPRYGFAALLGLDGHMVCGSGPVDPNVGARDRPYFGRVLETGAFVVGEYEVGRGSGNPSLPLAQPVRDLNGAVNGVVMVSLSLAWLKTQLAALAPPEGTSAAILDRNGAVLADVPADAGSIGRVLRSEPSVPHGTDVHITRATSRSGREQIVAYVPPGAGRFKLAAIVGVDAATAEASMTESDGLHLWLIVISSLLALLLTVLFGRRLINRPVARLLETAARWRAGDLSARSELRRDFSEFGRLAAAFDSMAATLQAREHALNMALESTLDAVVVFDRDWRYVYANARARAMNGCDRVGRVLWEDTPEAVGTPIAAALQEAVRTGQPTQVDGYVVTQKRYLQINAYPSTDGLTVFFRDLTEERRMAAALRDSEARLQLAREAAGFGVWERDYLTDTKSWSYDEWRLFGLSPQESAPDDATFNALVHPADLDQLLEEQRAFRMGGTDKFTTEYRVVWPDGSIHWMNDRVKMLRAADGTPQRAVGVTFDVTERRDAEEKLRLTTERFQVAIDSTPIMLFCQDRDLRFTWVYNPHRSYQAAAVIGRTDREIMSRLSDAEVIETIKREVILTGIGTRREVAILTDGEELHYDMLVEPMRDHAGRIEGIRCASIDITEQKRIEAQLRQVTAELREAHRIARLGNWQFDVARGLAVVSDEVRRILGLDPDGPVPRRWAQRGTVYPDHAWETVNAAIERAIATGEGFDLDLPAWRGSEPIWINVRAEAVRSLDGSVSGLRGTLQDITDRKRIESALRDSELRLRISQEAGRIGSWDWNLESDQFVWSELQYRQFGVAPDDGSPVTFEHWRAALHPDDLAPSEARLRASLMKDDFLEMDYRIVTQQGTRWMHSRAHVMRDPDGNAVRMIGIDMDITERRRLEDELRGLTRTLELRIEQEVAARETAQARAAQAERIQALGQLAGGIAHDFNNVLQTTMGALSLIQRRPNDHDGIRRIARMAGEACERGASITRRLLSFARRGELHAGPVDIAELLVGLQEILSHTLGAGIDVHVVVANDMRPALVDRSQLETVLVNLATNARDAMPAGGRLVLSSGRETLTQEGPANASGLPPGNYVRLAVADTGQGMDAATLGRVAEPFFTTKGQGKGTGLGLSMAKGFVEQSGGALTIASTLGLGTTITLWLPEAAPGSRAPARPDGHLAEAEADSSAPRKRVLLVDDQDSVRVILAAQLHDAGFDVVAAASGEQAIAMIAGGLAVDALISDLSMPQIDGLAVISAAQQHLPRLPAILLTGYAGDDAALAVSGAIRGSFSLLRKPVDDARLVDRLSTLLAAADVAN